MQLYVVGGAVRDRLLGLPAADRDWVAVGATPHELLALGYKPVGKDFPVFLHPQTGEEVALARTERKTGRGYTGFSVHAAPGVTLEEDLGRRDLTINAIAQAEDGTLIDPFGGQADLRAKVLRHVSPAFVEDPVRLLRLARFAARFADFAVARETLALLRAMVDAGELDTLVPERVWQELARGLLAAKPGRMLTVLHDSGALRVLMPELAAGWQAAAARLDRVAVQDRPLPVAWALLLAGAGLQAADAEGLSARLKAPTTCRDLAVLLAREATALAHAGALTPAAQVALFNRCDAFRRAPRFQALLQAARQEGHAVAGLAAAFGAAQAVDAAAAVAAAAARGAQGPALKLALDEARTRAVALQHTRPGGR